MISYMLYVLYHNIKIKNGTQIFHSHGKAQISAPYYNKRDKRSQIQEWTHLNFCEVQNQVKFTYSDRGQGGSHLEEGQNQLEGCDCPRSQPDSYPLSSSPTPDTGELDIAYIKSQQKC